MDTGQFLRPANSRTPIFYMPPKIHKPNNPGRPVISSVNSHTEKLVSAYVDEFLRPMAQALPSHIRDTTDFIIRLKNLGRDPENSILATLDVSSLYTNILYFRIPHNTLCLPPQILHKPLFLNAPGSIAFSQEHFKAISYAKFGGQTECIMGNSKIVNRHRRWTCYN